MRDYILSRRHFLQASSVAALSLSGSAFGQVFPPSEKIHLGVIGLGMEGYNKNLRVFSLQPDARIVAVCDVDSSALNKGKLLVNRAYGDTGVLATQDWREVIARPDIDGIVIATPDHWHAHIAIEAMLRGKDVFCEKPVSLTIDEGRRMSNVARRLGRVFLTASEARTSSIYHRMCELVRNGHIGRLYGIHVRVYRGFGQDEMVSQIYPVPMPPPPELDYDMWLGPAPEAPYSPPRCSPAFRYIYDYAGGNLSDWGAHLLDIAQWGNDTEHTGPHTVSATGAFADGGLFDVATDWDIRYEFANGVALRCTSGGYNIRFEGTDGWLEGDTTSFRASSRTLENAYLEPGELQLPHESANEHRNFINAVRLQQPSYAPAEVGHRTASLSHLGNIALRTGETLKWDPVGEHITNSEHADRLVRRPRRAPWQLPV